MKRWNFRAVILLLVIFAANATFAGTPPETAGQVLAKLNNLAPEQRQKTLVEKARAEGEVAFYSSLQAQQIDPFIRVFQKRYPFIKVNPYRVSGNRQVIKIQTEMNAGNHLFDVTNGSAEQASALKKIGAIDPYQSPQRQFFNTPNKDKDGYFTSLYVIPIVLGYNTNLVKRPDAPKTYDDLLQPKWKSNMFLDDESYEWFAVLLKQMGRDKGTSVHAESRQTGFAAGPRPYCAKPVNRCWRKALSDCAFRPHRPGLESSRRADRSNDPRSLFCSGEPTHAGAPCAPSLRRRAVCRLGTCPKKAKA